MRFEAVVLDSHRDLLWLPISACVGGDGGDSREECHRLKNESGSGCEIAEHVNDVIKEWRTNRIVDDDLETPYASLMLRTKGLCMNMGPQKEGRKKRLHKM